MTTVIHENQPCYWTVFNMTGTTGPLYSSNFIGGSTSTASGLWNQFAYNAQIQNIIINQTPASTATLTIAPLDGTSTPIVLTHTGTKTEPHDIGFGGDVGTLLRKGFSVSTSVNGWSFIVFWRPL